MRKYAVPLLLIGNGLLLASAWIAALYAYPRLPEKIPVWINFLKGIPVVREKSCVFYLYPLVQSLVFFVFLGLFRYLPPEKLLRVPSRRIVSDKIRRLLSELKKEFILMILIFINLVFIHIQTSLIFLAHRAEKGFNKLYFVSLFAIIIILIPYYRFRAKLLAAKFLRM